MGALGSSKGKDNCLIVQGRNNARSKEKQIVKDKKPKPEIKDEGSKPTDEDSMKKVKKKGRKSKCSYFSKGFNIEINISTRIWTSCIKFLRITKLNFQMS